ncbi:MAG: hypothetical protein H2056_05175 [Sphingopyxis sp.]|nr:hypothetical protein [Sphingopyxis sp.]
MTPSIRPAARSYAAAIIAEIAGVPQGFALFVHNFSTMDVAHGKAA